MIQFGQVVFEPGSRFITDSGYLGLVGFFDTSGFRASGDVGTPVGSDFSRLSRGGFLGLPLISNVCLPVQLSRACGVWPRNCTPSLRVATRLFSAVHSSDCAVIPNRSKESVRLISYWASSAELPVMMLPLCPFSTPLRGCVTSKTLLLCV